MRAAKQATEELRGELGYPLLCQGDDATAQLVRQFAEDEATCLFGTLSLWQGVDVPGPALQLVVIDRIPFPRPDDPLASARQRAVAARGGNGFMTVAAAHAGLLLAQGAGRLLRTMEDKGMVAVLDPRLATARYGGFLRASLPPFWATADPAVARAALRRLAARAGDIRRCRFFRARLLLSGRLALWISYGRDWSSVTVPARRACRGRRAWRRVARHRRERGPRRRREDAARAVGRG